MTPEDQTALEHSKGTRFALVVVSAVWLGLLSVVVGLALGARAEAQAVRTEVMAKIDTNSVIVQQNRELVIRLDERLKSIDAKLAIIDSKLP